MSVRVAIVRVGIVTTAVCADPGSLWAVYAAKITENASGEGACATNAGSLETRLSRTTVLVASTEIVGVVGASVSTAPTVGSVSAELLLAVCAVGTRIASQRGVSAANADRGAVWLFLTQRPAKGTTTVEADGASG